MQDGSGPSPKQLLGERIKNATNILVTVSRDPSVDELSAALALTLMLNKLDKHATAVFSGKIPPAIEFLNPHKTFEGTVDSLRDFIIALDKEKADRLRYKVEDDVVRIFITPYRTTITQKDLAFSQGDFNVELIIALGVEKKEDLDAAITAHGRILHDATVATVNNTNQHSDLGSIDWTDATASSFSEMLMSLSESLKSGILDEQIATALLTGIVAATERFSNNRTTPKIMTMSAQLMAAGANQQLIATKLEEGDELRPVAVQPDGSTKLQEGSSEKVNKAEPEPVPVAPATSDGEMHVEHEDHSVSASVSGEVVEAEIVEAPVASVGTMPLPVQPTLSVEDLKKDIAAANDEVEQAAKAPVVDESAAPRTSDWKKSDDDESDQPMFGGTLNATADEAHEAKEREERLNRNRSLLSHDTPGSQPSFTSDSSGYLRSEPSSVDPFAEPPRSEPDSPMHYEAIDTHAPTVQPLMPPQTKTVQPVQEPKVPTLAELEAQAHSAAANNPVSDARAAVNAALDSLPFNPANQPLAASGAQPLSGPTIHGYPASDDNSFAPPPVDSSSPSLPPSPPPLPDFSTLPPLPDEPGQMLTNSTTLSGSSQSSPAPAMSQPAASTSSGADPGQFKLPGS